MSPFFEVDQEDSVALRGVPELGVGYADPSECRYMFVKVDT